MVGDGGAFFCGERRRPTRAHAFRWVFSGLTPGRAGRTVWPQLARFNLARWSLVPGAWARLTARWALCLVVLPCCGRLAPRRPTPVVEAGRGAQRPVNAAVATLKWGTGCTSGPWSARTVKWKHRKPRFCHGRLGVPAIYSAAMGTAPFVMQLQKLTLLHLEIEGKQ